jgi:uncharacterized protein
MRRKDREITNPAEIRAVLEKADVCRLAMSDNNIPYLVTMNFGIKTGEKIILYFHAAPEGRKIDILKRNNLVCFGTDIDHELVITDAGAGCDCAMNYSSISGMGSISFISGRAEKIEALEAIMQHYAPKPSYSFPEEMIDRTTILRLDVTEITGKRRA